ncbi:hypothetical protein ACNHYB_13085 [Isoptericola jiangsuensis]|uniref:hypothetical protein n=1 Tax=Isoptericola jiangsuensis TaxID=548579 RepID=UPI003AAD09E4
MARMTTYIHPALHCYFRPCFDPDDFEPPIPPDLFPFPWPESHGGPLPDPWGSRGGRRDDDRRLQFSVVQLAMRLADAASVVQAQSGTGHEFLRSVMDDGWGIEGRPPGLVLPAGWWRLVPWERPPRPQEDVHLRLGAALVAGGLTFEAMARTIRLPELQEALREAAVRSIEAASIDE